MPAIRHRAIAVDGLNLFVREAGNPEKPTIVLLPGYPSSTRAYIRLIDRLACDWHAVAIDYPGFGSSDPLPESPTFDRLAEVTAKTIDALGISDYVMYMFDFGAPVGFRIALEHDQRVRGIVTQNANAYVEGFGPGVAALSAWWADREGGQATVDGFVSLAGTQMQRDYQSNPPRYDAWQTWLRLRQPTVLAIWGRTTCCSYPPAPRRSRATPRSRRWSCSTPVTSHSRKKPTSSATTSASS